MLLALAALLLLAGNVLAGMSSTNYRLDWYVVLTGGGGPTASASYAANFTIGQTARGSSSSTNYEAGLGYWYGEDVGGYEIYLPVVVKDHSS